MLQEVLTVVTPVFVIAGIGFAWIKRGQPFDNDTVSSLVMYIGSPCLIFSSLTTHAPDLQTLAQIALTALFVICAAVAVAYVFLKVMGWPITSYLPALVHPNTGNMGLPVVWRSACLTFSSIPFPSTHWGWRFRPGIFLLRHCCASQ